MILDKNIKIIGKSLFLIKEKILVISDLHIGYEQIFLKNGFFVPKIIKEEIKKDIFYILKRVKPNKILILGDLKHDFSKINKKEKEEILEILYLLKQNCKEIILIKGNHDNALEYLIKKLKVIIKDFHIEKEYAFFHGDKIFKELFNKKIKFWIVGHNHPAITIKKYVKKEKYKCFLIGKYKSKKIIILPSFFPLVEGIDIFENEDLNLDFKINKENFNIYVVSNDNNLYDFGKLKNIKSIFSKSLYFE